MVYLNMIKVWMLMDFMDNVSCRRKVIKDKGGSGKFFLKEEKWLK